MTRLLSVSLAFAVLASSLAADDNPRKCGMRADTAQAKAILEKANKTMKNMKGFSATIVSETPTGKKAESKYYLRNNPDGTMFMRMEMKGGMFSMVFLSNADGFWDIVGNTAIKMSYMTKMQTNMMGKTIGKLPEFKSGCEYSVASGKVGEIPCYVVTSKLSKKQFETLADTTMKALPPGMLKALENSGKKMDLTSMIPMITKQYIGKKDYFAYSVEQFSKNGSRISKISYTDVKLNVSPDEKLFRIPKNMEVKTAKTMTEYADAIIKASMKKAK